MSKGKLAIVLLVEESEKQGGGYDSDLVDSESYETSPSSLLQKLLFDDQRFVKVVLIFIIFYSILQTRKIYYLYVLWWESICYMFSLIVVYTIDLWSRHVLSIVLLIACEGDVLLLCASRLFALVLQFQILSLYLSLLNYIF